MVFSTNYVELHAWYVTFGEGLWHLLPISTFWIRDGGGPTHALYVMLYRTRFGSSVRASLADQRRRRWWHQRQTSLDRVLWSWRRVTAAGG